ncbi:MAG: hypothetical protein GY940_26780, partial [bacterium]|nr:hypothetical protein [bacterium]
MQLPASYHQERLWFIDKFENGVLYESAPVYHNIPLVLTIKGPLDSEVLEKSIQDVIDRHEALRTLIVTREDKPFQQVSRNGGISISVSQKARQENENKNENGDGYDNDYDNDYDSAVSAAFEEAGQPFSLHRDPLIRATLFPFEDHRYTLLITMHHIIADRFSMGILVNEIFACYDGYLKSKPPQLPELPIHYVDFAQWQNQMPAKLMDSLFSYWKSQLSGKLQALELPEDRTRPLIHTYRGKRQTITFPKEICRRARDFGKQHGAGNFITLFAVFKVLLYKYTGQEEIV